MDREIENANLLSQTGGTKQVMTNDETRESHEPQTDWSEIYDELVKRARAILNDTVGKRRQWFTLDTSALIAEVYIKQKHANSIERLLKGSRNTFYAFMYRSMKQVILDYKERRSAKKRTPTGVRVAFDDVTDGSVTAIESHLRVMDYLIDIESNIPKLANVFSLLYVEGHNPEEVATILSEETGERVLVESVLIDRDFIKCKLKDLEAME